MGILTRKQGTGFLIGSDRSMTDAPTSRPPKVRPTDSVAVWTGHAWSAVMNEALLFGTLDEADNYVRANYPKLSGQTEPTRPRGAPKRRQPRPPVATSPASPVESLNSPAAVNEPV
jgi:hypothetical protein